MIQRIQSVYLALVAICMEALYFTSIATFSVADKTFIFSIFSLNQQGAANLNFGMYATFLLGLTTTIIVVSSYCIFAYKNRVHQMKYVRLNTLLLLAFIALGVTAFSNAPETISTSFPDIKTNSLNTNYLFGSITPFIAIILNILAFRAIKKDEELVRSADRIR